MSKKKAKAKAKQATALTPVKPRALYEAANPLDGRSNKSWRDHRDGDATVAMAGSRLRNHARNLDQNHDISRGALDRLVQMVIGPNGIAVEPLPHTKNGKLYRSFAEDLLRLWDDWTQWPDVTWEQDWIAMQHLLGRSLFRDGEVLAQTLAGDIPTLDHGTLVPFSLEMIEADHLPFDLNDPSRGITQGVERNAWGRPRAYHLYKAHPGAVQSLYATTMYGAGQLKRVPTDDILHLKLCDRIKQARGVSKLAAAILRLNDVKEYENSERIAAKVAASLTAYIKKTNPELMPEGYSYTDPNPDKDSTTIKRQTNEEKPRAFSMQAGMVFDDLRPGEDVGLIDSKRPNPNLETFRRGQLRAAAAGVGISYSSFARDYDGTYSAQRQELVEQQGFYEILTALFIGQFSRPVWQRFVTAAVTARAIKLPSDLDQRTLTKAVYRGPAMIWIDPLKEIQAHIEAVNNHLSSQQKVIRQRGDNPSDILRQIADWNEQLDELNIPRLNNAANPRPNPQDNPDALVSNSRIRQRG